MFHRTAIFHQLFRFLESFQIFTTMSELISYTGDPGVNGWNIPETSFLPLLIPHASEVYSILKRDAFFLQ